MIARYRSSFAASTGFVAATPPARVIDAGRVARTGQVAQPATSPAATRAGRPPDAVQRNLMKNSA